MLEPHSIDWLLAGPGSPQVPHCTHLRCLCRQLTWSTSNHQIGCRIKAWFRTRLAASLLVNTGDNFVLGSPWPLCVSLFCFPIIQYAVWAQCSFSVWPASPSSVTAINVILAGQKSVCFFFSIKRPHGWHQYQNEIDFYLARNCHDTFF